MVTVRNYIEGEYLPWTREEIGWPPTDFDPDWVWVVFVNREMTALLVTAKVGNSILLVRILSKVGPAWWLRPLWSHVRSVCGKRQIDGFWSCMDNGREPERKLLKLLAKGSEAAAEILVRQATGVVVSGRF